MKINKCSGTVLSAVILGMMCSSARGNIIFSQNFSESAAVADYYDLTQPDAGQWNSIFYGSIVNGALSFTRSGSSPSVGTFTRSADFSPALQALIYRFTLRVKDNLSQSSSAAVWQVGAGFVSGTGVEPSAKAHSQLTLDLAGTGAFRFRDGSTVTSDYGGARAITWVINNSGGPLQYLAPGDRLETIQDDRWDLWIDGMRVFNERLATTADIALTDLKFAFKGGAGSLVMDDFMIQSVESVPEPVWVGALAVVFLGVIVVFGKRGGGRRRTDIGEPTTHVRKHAAHEK